MEQRYRVVIIGAGIAGLSCAKYLMDNNIKDFIMIEAHNEIGGRCQTIQLCKTFTSMKILTESSSILVDHALELGVDVLYGEPSNNPLYQLAQEHQLIDIDDRKMI